MAREHLGGFGQEGGTVSSVYGKMSLAGVQKRQAAVREIKELVTRQGGDRSREL